MNECGKSDGPVVPAKLPNNAASAAAEVVEERGPAKENAASKTHPGHSAGSDASSALDRVRRVAEKDKEARFTALLHHVTVDRLRAAYRAINPRAATGVDGVRWRDYGKDLEGNLRDLHGRVHRGSYRAKPSRRTYIPKTDGRLRPLGIAALEDKIVQRATVEVLEAIYESDFVGFSYGFRPGRGPHDALDALAVGMTRKKVNWVLDADIRDFFTSLDRLVGEVPRAPYCGHQGAAPDRQVVGCRHHRGRRVVKDRAGGPAGSIGFAVARQRLPALCLRPVGEAVARSSCPR